ncbi:MAG: hypothetical protein GC162_08445 [Planctomycetes bacterium]|nr:hypothetical protein [Planctomycetota bacterium]
MQTHPRAGRRQRRGVNGAARFAVLTLALFAGSLCAAADDFHPRSLLFLLQADRISHDRAAAAKAIADAGRDLMVIDMAFSGPNLWTADDLRTMRAEQPQRRIVAYLSIGEAGEYRDYWQRPWKHSPPDWLLSPNPDWPDDHRVKYWDPRWQAIILAELDRILAQGFDGVYLDIVDAFEFFEHDTTTDTWIDHRPNHETANTYRQDMIAWVKKVAQHARAKNPGFLIIPQNGVQLLEDADYEKLISAVGVEDLFTDGKKRQPPKDHTDYQLSFLRRTHKPVMIIEYATKPNLRQISIDGAKAAGYVLLLTDRNLTTLGQSP